MSVSFSSESFELVIFSVFSRVNDDAKKAFNFSAINFKSELISPFSLFREQILSLTCCLLFTYLKKDLESRFI